MTPAPPPVYPPPYLNPFTAGTFINFATHDIKATAHNNALRFEEKLAALPPEERTAEDLAKLEALWQRAEELGTPRPVRVPDPIVADISREPEPEPEPEEAEDEEDKDAPEAVKAAKRAARKRANAKP